MSNKDMSAYPGTVLESRRDPESGGIGQEYVIAPGLTKLEAFTMVALQGFCANPAIIDRACDKSAGYTAKAAVDFAEAALAELEGRG